MYYQLNDQSICISDDKQGIICENNLTQFNQNIHRVQVNGNKQLFFIDKVFDTICAQNCVLCISDLQFTQLTIKDCIVQDRTIQYRVSCLHLIDSTLIKFISNSIAIEYRKPSNIHKYPYNLTSLKLFDQKVDLKQLEGDFSSVFFVNCQFSNKCSQKLNCKTLNVISCDNFDLNVFQSVQSEINVTMNAIGQKFAQQNNNCQLNLTLKFMIIDFSKIKGRFNTLKIINCELKGKSSKDLVCDTLSLENVTEIDEKMIENAQIGTFIIKNSSKCQINLKQLKNIHGELIELQNQAIDLKDLKNWKEIVLNQCTLKNFLPKENKCKIQLIKCKIKDYQNTLDAEAIKYIMNIINAELNTVEIIQNAYKSENLIQISHNNDKTEISNIFKAGQLITIVNQCQKFSYTLLSNELQFCDYSNMGQSKIKLDTGIFADLSSVQQNKLQRLTINNSTINLDLLKGHWEAVVFGGNSQFIGLLSSTYFSSQQFGFKSFYPVNFMSSFKFNSINSLSLELTGHDDYTIDLALFNSISKIKELSLQQMTINFTGFKQQIEYLRLTWCQIAGQIDEKLKILFLDLHGVQNIDQFKNITVSKLKITKCQYISLPLQCTYLESLESTIINVPNVSYENLEVIGVMHSDLFLSIKNVPNLKQVEGNMPYLQGFIKCKNRVIDKQPMKALQIAQNAKMQLVQQLTKYFNLISQHCSVKSGLE
ncbi:Hypothetical_protein [Hexamita inflata]|uniref:Hypothetical_protein n=1 Tax=Hexamita inflata TaxID=28002 RepID=A0AA86TIU3_9EUKA|nr:Hypothetical protein HINF_LOCUS2013 [Hexamita inflata]